MIVAVIVGLVVFAFGLAVLQYEARRRDWTLKVIGHALAWGGPICAVARAACELA